LGQHDLSLSRALLNCKRHVRKKNKYAAYDCRLLISQSIELHYVFHDNIIKL